MTRAGKVIVAGSILITLTLLAGSTSAPAPGRPTAPVMVPVAGLVSFDSCSDALTELRAAARETVGPYGFEGGTLLSTRAAAEGRALAKGALGGSAPPDHSTTNNHEAGADEPDVVKTDGRRIVTVTGGGLRVIDPVSRRITGRLDLPGGKAGAYWGSYRLLLLGNRALVLAEGTPFVAVDRSRPGPSTEAARLFLVDLTGAPALIGTYRIEGSLLDGRLTGTTARVVIRSTPRLEFPYVPEGSDRARTRQNRAVIDSAGIESWLPEYEWTAGNERHTGRVDCDRLSRPERMTGTSVLTVLSFDLGTDRLGDGDPVSVAADANTVYGTPNSLYLAGQQPPRKPGLLRWRPGLRDQVTEIFQFDTAGSGRPRYLASGAVPGWLINQYALSEWDGHLRVATTLGEVWGDEGESESTVRVLRRDGGALVSVGAVGGLGRGERIYSVRYLGPVAYVVTFRQTDPLYSLDLSDPAAPRMTGELKITGYSAYLHPLPDGRLLGVGQEADGQGRTEGVQVSLFDVRDPSRPTRLDQWHLPRGWSTAEYDPHAFLHWPATGLVVLPVDAGVRLLRVDADKISEIGQVTHPVTTTDRARLRPAVHRALMIGDLLWTVSDAGLRASDPVTARSLDWIPTT
ncbi:beta-propeller domain-containing protein [Micromonospora sp. NPDC048871]|uniref:beta-propeller domain-containing protein n=1 Tax=unclassified Micromonospora TaxID=2617518 RepID=UPI002E104081|nr:beta-propeller domain-containing protein [Micromonospora sp. NBC_01739]